MTDGRSWIVDTSVFTHLARAGHLELLEGLAPGGVLIVPSEVNTEIECARDIHAGVPGTGSLSWVNLAVLTDDESWTALCVKANLGGKPTEHLGECAVIAVAHHRAGIALLDDRAAKKQAELLGVMTVDTLWIVVEAHKRLFGSDRNRTVAVVEALIETGMWLPLKSGEQILAFAYEQGWL